MKGTANVGVCRVAGSSNTDPPHDDQARIHLDWPGTDIAEDDNDGILRRRTQALAECPGHDVFKNDVDTLLGGQPPDLATELEIRSDNDLVCPRAAHDLRLLLRTGNRNHRGIHALGDLNLMQAKS